MEWRKEAATGMEDILLVQPNNMFVDIRFQDVSFTTVQKDGGGAYTNTPLVFSLYKVVLVMNRFICLIKVKKKF